MRLYALQVYENPNDESVRSVTVKPPKRSSTKEVKAKIAKETAEREGAREAKERLAES